MSDLPKTRRSLIARVAPAIVMMILAPTFTELALGGTRLSTLLAFPAVLILEILVWGGAAALLRGLARQRGLGWGSLLLFGLALSVAEEFVIQQTSIAPLVIRLHGVDWGRFAGVNYVYAVWALAYETIWVVLMPALVAEMIFPNRRHEAWLTRSASLILIFLFVVGAAGAWYAWTRVARVQTFHMDVYAAPLPAILISVVTICVLFIVGIWWPPRFWRKARPPRPIVVGLMAGGWAGLWFALVLLAFGIAPAFPAVLAFFLGIILALLAMGFLPRWATHPLWTTRHSFALVAGLLIGAMLASFVGFIDARPEDLVFKAVIDLVIIGILFLLRPTAGFDEVATR